MNFIDKFTGRDMTRDYKEFEKRAKKLPADYQKAWAEIKASVWEFSDFSGRNLTPILANALSFLEESAGENQSAKDVLGDDIKGFAKALAGGEGAKTYRDKWRDDLNKTVAKKLGKESK
jgi:DNA-binding ferritin-like protein (Dps family)